MAEIFAIAIFVGMFLLIIIDKFERQWITLGSGLAVLVVVFGICMKNYSAIIETLNLKAFFTQNFWYSTQAEDSTGINWSTIVFIAGMMIMVEGLGHAGFFRWLCLFLAKRVKYHTVPLLICFMIMSAVLAMFIDSITVVLFLASVTAELSRILKFNPVPMILSEIFCANLGGAATMCGDPPNIIIGTSLGYSFTDFVTNTGVIVAICFVPVLIYFWLCFRKELKASEEDRDPNTIYPQPAEAIKNKKAFVGATLVFASAVALLVTHAQTHLTVSCIGVIVSILTLISTIAFSGFSVVKYIIKRIDYKTLLFFIGLFVSVAGLEKTGVLNALANFIGEISEGNIMLVIIIILVLSAVASAFVDNIPFAATMVPVIQSMAASQGISLEMLAWTLSLGTDLGGNATPIGASANVVGTSVAAKEGHIVTWGKYCRYCVPATVIVIVVSILCIFQRYL